MRKKFCSPAFNRLSARFTKAILPALVGLLVVAPLAATPAYAQPASPLSDAAASASVDELALSVPVRPVTGGVVRGYVDADGVQTYKGIPYAADTSGENRWQAPQAVKPWRGIKKTTEFGPIAVQNPAATSGFGPWTTEYIDYGKTLENGQMSEDSLSLNVWTKAKPNENKPVIVYIHGGGNQSGSGAVEMYSGEEIAQKDVIYLTINYRVGIFGFLAYKDATGEEVTGNFAVQDMVASLKWVQENIRAFGGDPSDVTIAGQSAGSSDVQSLISSPAAAGLFDRAVAMSSNSITRNPSTLEQAQARATEAFGQYTLEELRAMSAQEIQTLSSTYNPTSTVIDEVFITSGLKDAYAAGSANPVDLMIGSGDGDGGVLRLPDDNSEPYDRVTSVTPAAYESAVTEQLGAGFLELYPADPTATNVIEVARALNSDGMVSGAAYHADVKDAAYPDENSYLYQFSRIVPDTPARMNAYGAFHTGDVSYWLDYYSSTVDRPWTDIDYRLGDTMSSYLVDFAADGTVDGWPKNDRTSDTVDFMHFGDETMVDTLDKEKSALWSSYWAPEDAPESDTGISVEAEIEADEPGSLMMTVAADAVSLGKVDGAADRRRFAGVLPTTTVTDSRNAEQAAGGGWSVAGQSTAFSATASILPASHLGWSPKLAAPKDGVQPGDSTPTAIDGGNGLASPSSLASADTSGRLGTADLGADLYLEVPFDVAPGTYSGILTVSLFAVD